MHVDITGDPGSDNTYNQTEIQSVGNYNPAATTAITNYNFGYVGYDSKRMGTYFQKLMEEIRRNVAEETIDELRYYCTRLDGTKDMEEKLTDGNFPTSEIQDALRLKELYAKRAARFEYYPSAQQITLMLFSRIKHEFNTYIFPLIEAETSHTVVMQEIRSRIVKPIMQVLDDNDVHEYQLNYHDDHIYGMIYYLTGMCHLNWKNYDNI